MNYFDIQVLMIVTVTEMLTSTLHHNIFPYLDYIFSATFTHIYIYIYICIYIYIYGRRQPLPGRNCVQAAVMSILLYGCTTWTLTKRLERKLDGNYTRMLRAVLNKSWRQHPPRHQLYGHLPPHHENYTS